MNADRSSRIAVAFAMQVVRSPNSSLCAACLDVLDVAGAGITVMSGGQAGPVCVSSTRMAALEDMQFTMGEGPCHDAFVFGRPVHAPRFDQTVATRWPSFASLAQQSGIGAVFAYPMSTDGARIGVLTLYQDAAGELTGSQHDDSLALAEVLAETVLGLQDMAPTGVLAPELEEAVAHRAEVHQATGIVAVQLQIPADQALLRIRAYAFANGVSVGTVAADIVGHRLRLADDREERRPQQPGTGV